MLKATLPTIKPYKTIKQILSFVQIVLHCFCLSEDYMHTTNGLKFRQYIVFDLKKIGHTVPKLTEIG